MTILLVTPMNPPSFARIHEAFHESVDDLGRRLEALIARELTSDATSG